MNLLVCRFQSFWPKIQKGVAGALGRFPYVLGCGLLGSMVAIASLHLGSRYAIEGTLCRLLMTMALGMPLFFALRMLKERLSPRVLGSVAEMGGALVLVACYFLLPAKPTDAPEIIWIQWGLLLGCFHFFAAVSPYLWATEPRGFFHFNWQIFLRFCLAVLYTGVLTVGLELALFSADKLFGLKLGSIYGDLYFLMAGCFHPVFFLAGVPVDLEALNTEPQQYGGQKVFTQFALAPLVAVYTCILYLYGIKILLAGQWPHGWVALPVLVLAGVGILSALLLHPLRTRAEEKWAGWFCRWYPRAMVPLSLLLLLSVRERIAAYGVTEERYLGLVIGAWIMAWSLIFSFMRRPGIRWIPASLALICLVAAFGPMSAGVISKQSQIHRLRGILARHGLLTDGKIIVQPHAKEIPGADFDQLHSAIEYLIKKHGAAPVRGILGEALSKVDWIHLPRWGAANDLLFQLKLKGGPGAVNHSANFHHVTLEPTAALPIAGYRRAWVVRHLFSSGDWKYRRRSIDGIQIGIEDGELKCSEGVDAKPQPMGLAGPVTALAEDPGSSELTVEKMSADWLFKGRKFRLVFTSMDYNLEADGKKRINSADLIVLEE